MMYILLGVNDTCTFTIVDKITIATSRQDIPDDLSCSHSVWDVLVKEKNNTIQEKILVDNIYV